MHFLKHNGPSPIVEAARKQLGYRAQVNRDSSYGRQVKYNGQPWNGSFVDSVLRETGYRETSFVSTVSALQYFFVRGRLKIDRRLRDGDIVFLSFPTNRLYPFEQPHVAIVSDASRFYVDGTFRTIEGETGTGSPRGSQEVDGVFERIRSRVDLIGFVTPKRRIPKVKKEIPVGDLPKLRPSYFNSNIKTRTNAIAVLQTALAKVLDRSGFTQGAWDVYTQSALDEFRRQNGMLGKTGLPDETDLNLLDQATDHQIFRRENDDASNGH